MMRKKREKFLLFIFVAAILCAVGVIGGKRIFEYLEAGAGTLKEKETQTQKARNWLEEKEAWQARAAWLDAHPLPAYEGKQTEAAFVQEIQDSLSIDGIVILEQRIQESVYGPRIVEIGIDLVLQCSLEQFVRWMHGVRKIDAYRSIRRVRVSGDGHDGKIRSEVSIVRFYEKAN